MARLILTDEEIGCIVDFTSAYVRTAFNGARPNLFDTELYWKPLFSIVKPMLSGRHNNVPDDIIWDALIFHGISAVQSMRGEEA